MNFEEKIKEHLSLPTEEGDERNIDYVHEKAKSQFELVKDLKHEERGDDSESEERGDDSESEERGDDSESEERGDDSEEKGRDSEPEVRSHDSEPEVRGHVSEPEVRGHVSEPEVRGHVSEPEVRGHVSEPEVRGHVSEPEEDKVQEGNLHRPSTSELDLRKCECADFSKDPNELESSDASLSSHHHHYYHHHDCDYFKFFLKEMKSCHDKEVSRWKQDLDELWSKLYPKVEEKDLILETLQFKKQLEIEMHEQYCKLSEEIAALKNRQLFLDLGGVEEITRLRGELQHLKEKRENPKKENSLLKENFLYRWVRSLLAFIGFPFF